MSENVPFNNLDPYPWASSALSHNDASGMLNYFIKASKDFIAIITPDQDLVYLNPALVQALTNSNSSLPADGNQLASRIYQSDKLQSWNDAINQCVISKEVYQNTKCLLFDGQSTQIIFKAFRTTSDNTDHILVHIFTPNTVDEDKGSGNYNFRKLFYENPQPMWIYDKESLQIMEVNNAAIHKYGYSYDEFIKLTIKDIRPSEDLHHLLNVIDNFTVSFKNVGISRHQTKHGQILYVEITGHTLEFNGRPAMHILINDVTEKVHAENQLKKQASIRERLFKLFSLASEMEENELYTHFLSMSMELSDSPSGFLVFMSPENTNIQTTLIIDSISKAEARKFKQTNMDGEISLGDWFSGKAEILNHISSETKKSWLKEYQLEVSSLLFIPVSEKPDLGIFIGLVNRSRDYTNDDLDALKALTGEFIKIVSKRKVDLALIKMEERWHFAVEGNNDGLWDWNLTKGEIFYSARWKEMLGYNETDIAPNIQSWENLLHPDDAANAKEQIHKYIEGEIESYHVEYRFKCKDGSWKWILDRGKIIEYTSDRKAARIIGTHKDISDRKAKELTIRSLNERLTLANKAARIGIWDWDLKTRQLTWDENMHLLYGLTYGENEITTDTWIDHVLPEDRHRVFTFFTLLLPESGGNELTFRIRKPDGSVRHIKSFGETETDPDGNPVRMIGVNYDITDIAHQEEIIRQNENIFQAAFDHSAIGMSLTSLEGKYFRVNNALCQILGYEEKELVSKSFLEISFPDDLQQNMTFFEEAKKGERDTYEMEKRYYHKTGDIIWVHLNVATVKDDEGKPTFFVSQVQDITLRKSAEASLRLSEERLRLAVEAANLGLFEINIKEQIFEINNSYSDQLQPEIFSGKKSGEFFRSQMHPNDLEKAYQAYYQYIKGETNLFNCELRIHSSNKEWRWFHILGKIVAWDESGTPFRMAGTIMDITERKMNELKIKEHLHELQRWHEATLGRENKIMELKREVNILLQESGKTPKYFSVL